MSRVIGVLEAAIAASKERAAADAAAISTLREQLAEANRRAHSDAAAIAEANARADRAEQGRDSERTRADALRDRLNAMQGQLADAHAALQRAETADARAERAERDKERAEQGRDAERVRADALRERLDDLTGKLSDAQAELAAAQDQADALARGLWRSWRRRAGGRATGQTPAPRRRLKEVGARPPGRGRAAGEGALGPGFQGRMAGRVMASVPDLTRPILRQHRSPRSAGWQEGRQPGEAVPKPRAGSRRRTSGLAR